MPETGAAVAAGGEAEGGRCAVCGGPAGQRCGGCLAAYYCSREHQRQAWRGHRKACRSFKVMQDDGTVGRHLVATRDLREGETVLTEAPLVWGPARHTAPVCAGCGRLMTEAEARPCARCGWPVCGVLCEQAPCHIPECTYTVQRGKRVMISNFEVIHPLYQCLTVLRCLYQKQYLPEVWNKLITLESHTRERKGTKPYETDRAMIGNVVLKFFKLSEVFTEEEVMDVCGIIQVNGHEIPLEEAPHVAVYHTAAMLEHSCRANCWKSFSNKGELVVVAGRPVRKGEHLSICYTDPLWSTPNRRHHLHETKFFWCACDRCRDPTEFGTYFSAVRCQKSDCDGLLLPETFIEDTTNDRLSDWRCTKCRGAFSCHSVQDVLDRIGEDLQDLEKGSVEACRKFMRECAAYLPPDQHYLTDLHIALAQMIGEEVDGNLSKVPDNDLDLKAATCRKVVKLLGQLVPGEKRLLGIILYTLQATLTEMSTRKCDQRMEYLKEAKATLETALKYLKHQSVLSADGKLYVTALLDLRRLETALQTQEVT